VVPQAPLSPRDFDRIRASGLQLRLQMSWPELEPSPGVFDFGELDAELEQAADRGIQVLPVLYGSPAWIAADPARPPLSRSASSAWRRFLAEAPPGARLDGSLQAAERPDSRESRPRLRIGRVVPIHQ
jgi:hypothetical protein